MSTIENKRGLRNNEYNSSTNCDDIIKNINMNNKNIIITGGTSGLGLQSAKVLANAGANVIICGRNVNEGKKICEEHKSISFHSIDYNSPQSIKEFVNYYHSLNLDKLDVLMLNAGAYGLTGINKETNVPTMIQVNHVGNQALFTAFLEDLKKSDDPRVIVLSSKAHTYVSGNDKFPLEKIIDNSYANEGDRAQYGISKAANVLFAFELFRRYPQISCNALHPGVIRTNIVRASILAKIFFFLGQPFFKDVNQGAATQLRLAVDPQLKGKGGMYFQDCNPSKCTKPMNDENIQKELWDWTDKIIEKMNIMN